MNSYRPCRLDLAVAALYSKASISCLSFLYLVFFTSAQAATTSIFFEQFDVNKRIPDGSPIGVSDSRIISTEIIFITEMTVSIEVADGFIGDLYAYLSFDSGFAVLLNRTGRNAGHVYGAPGNGMSVTFDDLAANGDIHLYQSIVDPLIAPLTGTWQPSGRNVDPADSFDTSPRTAFLSSFQGLDPNGSWTIFVADLESGGVANLETWSIQITGVIPEPSLPLLCLASMVNLLLRRADRSQR